jgi:ribosomal protein L44E
MSLIKNKEEYDFYQGIVDQAYKKYYGELEEIRFCYLCGDIKKTTIIEGKRTCPSCDRDSLLSIDYIEKELDNYYGEKYFCVNCNWLGYYFEIDRRPTDGRLFCPKCKLHQPTKIDEIYKTKREVDNIIARLEKMIEEHKKKKVKLRYMCRYKKCNWVGPEEEVVFESESIPYCPICRSTNIHEIKKDPYGLFLLKGIEAKETLMDIAIEENLTKKELKEIIEVLLMIETHKMK